ncbi:MAG: translation elongation factor Ts, partial [Lachnospiraceae bacterium]|nr:translation elongation factor Ts [Lachnospiraceae bacterium]
QALNSTATDMDAFLAEKWAKDPSVTVEDARKQAVSDISENIGLRRFERIEEQDGFVATYIHAGGKIGVLVDVETDVVNDAVREMGKNVAMQVAALSPKYTRSSEIEQSYIDHEKEILKAQIENDPKEAAKPDKVKEGMIMGRINKEMKEICLVDQVYVKAEDGKQSVQKYVDEVAKANNAKINIKRFVRFQTGEGMEKKEEDYAAEVAKQIAAAGK